MKALSEKMNICETFHPPEVGIFHKPEVEVPDPYFSGDGYARTGAIL